MPLFLFSALFCFSLVAFPRTNTALKCHIISYILLLCQWNYLHQWNHQPPPCRENARVSSHHSTRFAILRSREQNSPQFKSTTHLTKNKWKRIPFLDDWLNEFYFILPTQLCQFSSTNTITAVPTINYLSKRVFLVLPLRSIA